MFMEFLMGKKDFDLHAVGHADVLDLRLAEAVLSAAGWLCGHLPGVDGDGRVAELRHGERQSAVRELHGALRATRRAAVNYTFGSLKGLLQTAKKYDVSFARMRMRARRSC